MGVGHKRDMMVGEGELGQVQGLLQGTFFQIFQPFHPEEERDALVGFFIYVKHIESEQAGKWKSKLQASSSKLKHSQLIKLNKLIEQVSFELHNNMKKGKIKANIIGLAVISQDDGNAVRGIWS